MTSASEVSGSAASADQPHDAHESEARTDWEQRIYQRLTDTTHADSALALPAPNRVRALGHVGHIRLSWQEVPGAAGYVIERTEGPDGRPGLLHHGGSDVPAVPGCAFADTGLIDGVDYSYRIGAIAGAEYPTWAWSEPVGASTLVSSPSCIDVRVDAAAVTGPLQRVWQMMGAERLSQLSLGFDDRGHDIGAEFAAALRLARSDLGVRLVRAHAILHDDNEVVRRGPDGRLQFAFDRIDAVYDQILEMGIRPVVELSFMPAALACEPEQTVFTYRGIISPPADWHEWRLLIGALAQHLVDRYGIDEVAQWGFEVWNEPNLVVFWSGSQDDYLRLYEESARAIKAVDPRLRVGGPSTAASEWVATLATHAQRTGTALDFLSSHTYGNLPLDTRAALKRAGFAGIPVWWTEWGVGSTHFGAIHDSVIGAPFVLSGYAAAQGKLDALAYWVVSDHFEELGRPPRLFHNGFGLLSVGNLRKPRYWAAHLAAHLGDQVLASSVEGDGADVLVQAWATRHDDGTVDVLAWNGTINAALMDGDARLDRRVRLEVSGLDAARYRADRALVDEQHSNVVAQCPADVEWPDEELWEHLHAADTLHEARLPDVLPDAGGASFEFDLPMPGIVRIRLSAREHAVSTNEE
ncbi:MAG: xylan 1,4-beta-xylosidase [Actinomycetota bacterium]|nr:xylan 1,4-beta-xylosidase [Actinomycetota bacterium]